MKDKVVLVDDRDNELGLVDKLEAHQKGLLHRAFSLMVYREVKGRREYWLQKRSSDKYHGAGLWSNTCCSHPYHGESPEQGVQRRMAEELGIKQVLNLTQLEPILYRAELANGLIEHEYDHIYLSSDRIEDYAVNKHEVSEIAWVEEGHLRQMIERHPERYTPWLTLVLEKAREFLS